MYVEREKGLERVVSVAELLTVCSALKQLDWSERKAVPVCFKIRDNKDRGTRFLRAILNGVKQTLF